MKPLFVFGRFEVGRLLRNWKFLGITVGFPVIFYLLFLGDRNKGEVIGGVRWPVYLMISMCSFGALVAGLTAGGGRLAGERASGWARQLRVTPLPAWSYVATKVTASMIVILPVIALVEVVGASFGDVTLPAGRWVGLAAVLWFAALPFAVLGVFIGFSVTADTSFAVVTALMFVLGYFGGLFSPVSSMPAALRTAAHTLPSFHHAALGMDVAAGQPLGITHWLVLAGYVAVLSAAVILKHRREESKGLA